MPPIRPSDHNPELVVGWGRRHVALFRTRPGHWCSVPGCTGSQPLHWVPTRFEVEMEGRRPRGREADLPLVPRAPLYPVLNALLASPYATTPQHVHWSL